MKPRNLNLGTDRIEASDEPVQFPEDTMTPDELNARFDELMDEFCGGTKRPKGKSTTEWLQE